MKKSMFILMLFLISIASKSQENTISLSVRQSITVIDGEDTLNDERVHITINTDDQTVAIIKNDDSGLFDYFALFDYVEEEFFEDEDYETMRGYAVERGTDNKMLFQLDASKNDNVLFVGFVKNNISIRYLGLP